MGISAAGMVSGLDVDGLVSSLMSVERQPLQTLQSKQASFNAKVSAFGTLKSAVSTFQTAVKALSGDSLRALTGRARWTWITGNHDPVILDRCGGEVTDEALVDGLVLRHEAVPGDPRPELSGHFHPKLRLSVRGRSVARRCFVATETKLVLPAFGALTGGLDPDHPEIVKAVGREAHALVPVEDRMLRFPIAA